tara:strand:- start:1572 stop:3311 length:1740 start_codon:yes stop_codon:yes gene_type:complete
MVGQMANNATMRLLNDIKSLLEKTAPLVDEAGDKVDKFGNKVNAFGVAITRANKRTQIFKDTLKDLSERADPKRFELFSPRTLMSYRKQGGTVLEYFAEFLTKTEEDVRILGFEASKFRRFFFGFVPGSFAVLNKIALTFQFIGGTLRTAFPRAKKEITETTEEVSKLSKALGNVGKFLSYSGGFLGKKMIKDIRTSKLGTFFGLDTRKNIAGRRISRGLREGERAGRFVKQLTPFQKKREEFLEKLKNIKFADVMKSIGNTITLIGRRVAFFFTAFLAFVSGLYIILKLLGPTIKKALTATKAVVLFGLSLILPAMKDIFNGLKGIFNVFFGDGTLTDFINSIITLSWGILQLAVGLLITLGGAIITFVAGVGFGLFATIIEKISELSTKGKIALAAGALIAVTSFILGAPVWLVALIGIAVYKVGSILLQDGLKGLKDAILRVSIVRAAVDKTKDFFGGIGDKFSKAVNNFNKQIGGGIELGSGINIAGSYADGGLVRKTGMQLVGERGAELVRLNAGSRVYNDKDTKSMMGSTVNNFNITINAKDTSRDEMRKVADEIGRMVSTKINRRSSFRNSI